MNPGAEVSEGLYVCCGEKTEGSKSPSLVGFHGYPLKASNTYLFHFSEGMNLLIVRDLMIPREVVIICSLLSESVPNHMPFANEESALATSRLP